MSAIHFQLFGKFSARAAERELDVHALKDQELLCYLLIHRQRPHPREMLAALLRGNHSTERSKKYLRQALWHLQHVLESAPAAPGSGELVMTNARVQLNPAAGFWLDVGAFEH